MKKDHDLLHDEIFMVDDNTCDVIYNKYYCMYVRDKIYCMMILMIRLIYDHNERIKL